MYRQSPTLEAGDTIFESQNNFIHNEQFKQRTRNRSCIHKTQVFEIRPDWGYHQFCVTEPQDWKDLRSKTRLRVSKENLYCRQGIGQRYPSQCTLRVHIGTNGRT